MASHIVERKDLVDFVRSAAWKTAAHTFGNFHNTIIGLLVHAWINPKKRAGDRKERWVLEGAPSLDKKAPRRYSDGIFVSGTSPVGIMEVEGLHALGICTKMRKYLRPDHAWFGLCVFYPLYPRGRKPNRRLRFMSGRDEGTAQDDIAKILKEGEAVHKVTRAPMVMVFIEKEWQESTPDPNIGLRIEGSGYGRGRVTRIRGYLIAGKTHREEYRLWP